MAPMGSYMIHQGFREDCAKLIDRFRNLTSVRFEEFCEIWVDMKFSLVYFGSNSLSELREFSEETLAIAKEFFLPPLCYKERIGGLYLLYGLYYKMPISGPKIRAKPDDWPHILEFQEQIAQDKHHDASYILAKLMSDNAFVHCLFDRPFGLEKCYHQREDRPMNPYSVLPEIRELAEPDDFFDRINVLSNYYALKKSESTAENGGSTNPALKLYDSRFGQRILDGVKELEELRKSRAKSAGCNGGECCYKQREYQASRLPSTSKTPKERDVIKAQVLDDYNSDSSCSSPPPSVAASINDTSAQSCFGKCRLSDFPEDSSLSE